MKPYWYHIINQFPPHPPKWSVSVAPKFNSAGGGARLPCARAHQRGECGVVLPVISIPKRIEQQNTNLQNSDKWLKWLFLKHIFWVTIDKMWHVDSVYIAMEMYFDILLLSCAGALHTLLLFGEYRYCRQPSLPWLVSIHSFGQVDEESRRLLLTMKPLEWNDGGAPDQDMFLDIQIYPDNVLEFLDQQCISQELSAHLVGSQENLFSWLVWRFYIPPSLLGTINMS